MSSGIGPVPFIIRRRLINSSPPRTETGAAGEDQLLDLVAALGGLGLAAHHHDRRGVRGAHQPPAIVEDDAHAVYIYDFVIFVELALDRIHDLPFFFFGGLDAHLGRGVVARHPGHDLGKLAGPAGRRTPPAGWRSRWRRRSRSSGRQRRCGRSSRRPAALSPPGSWP